MSRQPSPSSLFVKTTMNALAGIALFTALSSAVIAADRKSTPAPPRQEPVKTGGWNVSVEVMMVAMPQERAIALLPDLRDPDKTEGAVTQILSAIEKKEATLAGWPMAVTRDGLRCVTESIFEKRYPTEFDVIPGSKVQSEAKAEPDKANMADGPVPTAFETRNTGATLEVEPTVIPGGEWIKLEMVPQRVVLLGFDSYDMVVGSSGKIFKVDQPQFYTVKTSNSFMVRNGRWSLIAIHKLPLPENQMEFFIARATASQIK